MMRISVELHRWWPKGEQWAAWAGDYDLGTPLGSGATQEAAIEDLLWHLDLEELPTGTTVEVMSNA